MTSSVIVLLFFVFSYVHLVVGEGSDRVNEVLISRGTGERKVINLSKIPAGVIILRQGHKFIEVINSSFTNKIIRTSKQTVPAKKSW